MDAVGCSSCRYALGGRTAGGRVRSGGSRQRRRVPAIVLGMGLGQCCRRHTRAVLECKEQVAVRRGIVRLQFQGPAVAGDRFVRLSPGPSAHCPGCCGPRHSPASVPAPGGSRRPPRPASPGPSSALPRLLWASASPACSSIARRQQATASSSLPCSRKATPRLLCASA